jgi:hypothetical protein
LLINEIFRAYLNKNPDRPEDWYGNTFDILYEKETRELQLILHTLIDEKEKQIT